VLSNHLRITATTALAPMAWGTTYLVTTELLPPDRPLTAGVIRALPAGLLILAITRTLPRGVWWWRSMVLGTLNIGAFFAFLFVAAYRLPGGVAATIGAIGPLVVGLLAARFLGEAFTRRRLLAGAAGIVGVGLLVLQANGRLDLLGLAAALGGVLSMSSGIVLAKKWGQPERPLVTTSWQLTAGGAVLLPLALLVEGLPRDPLTGGNVAGYAYLSLVGAALAYTLWFRGISALPVGSITFLSLLSPVVAVLAGWAVLGQALSPGQLVGAGVVIGAVLVATLRPGAAVSERAALGEETLVKT
jgi:probable blue pigment (indigoidine) exporter